MHVERFRSTKIENLSSNTEVMMSSVPHNRLKPLLLKELA
jgi:hypothetical protein